MRLQEADLAAIPHAGIASECCGCARCGSPTSICYARAAAQLQRMAPAGWLLFVALGTARQAATEATPTRDALPLRIVNHCLQSLHWLRCKHGREEHASHVLQAVQLAW